MRELIGLCSKLIRGVMEEEQGVKTNLKSRGSERGVTTNLLERELDYLPIE